MYCKQLKSAKQLQSILQQEVTIGPRKKLPHKTGNFLEDVQFTCNFL